jgi:hypothetical protein
VILLRALYDFYAFLTLLALFVWLYGDDRLRFIAYGWNWFLNHFRKPGVLKKLSSEFCAEVAVLVAVFPLLEWLLRGKKDNSNQDTYLLPAWAWPALVGAIVIGTFVAAVILKEPEDQKGRD